MSAPLAPDSTHTEPAELRPSGSASGSPTATSAKPSSSMSFSTAMDQPIEPPKDPGCDHSSWPSARLMARALTPSPSTASRRPSPSMSGSDTMEKGAMPARLGTAASCAPVAVENTATALAPAASASSVPSPSKSPADATSLPTSPKGPGREKVPSCVCARATVPRMARATTDGTRRGAILMACSISRGDGAAPGRPPLL
jgi:hypothetical protein